MLFLITLALTTPLLQVPEHASPDLRFELGQRMQQMEVAFEEAQDQPQLRREALAAIEDSVQSFFSLDLPGAARALDRARATLNGRASTALDSLAVAPNSWVLEPGEPFRLTVSQLYAEELPNPLMIRIAKTGERVAVESLPFTFDYGPIDVPKGPNGTRERPYGSSFGDRSAIVAIYPEVIADARARARKVQQNRSEKQSELAPWVAATSRYHLEILSELLRGFTLETQFPAEFLLARSEALLKADQEMLQQPGALHAWVRGNAADTLRARSGAPQGQEWIALPREDGGRDEVRIFVPHKPVSVRPPLVIALHGSGGSENMYFEGYGNGKAVDLAAERGWFLAAPKVGSSFELASVTQQLIDLLGADPQRVFVMGHSMGAMKAISSAEDLEAAQLRVAGMVLVGGGRPTPNPARLAALSRLPLLIQVGERDFALPGVESLLQQLEQDEHPRLTQRVVQNTEHLTVVQVGLDQAFEWMQDLLDQRAE